MSGDEARLDVPPSEERRSDLTGFATSAPADLAPTRRREIALRRADVYAESVVDGRELHDGTWARLLRWLKHVTTSEGERREAEIGAQLAGTAAVTRTNTIAVVSPKGGVGKTTCTFLLGNLLASHLRMRVLAVDANRDFGTLAALAPDKARVDRSLADLLADMAQVSSAPEILPYVSGLPSGLHLLAAPSHAEVMAEMTPELYGELQAFLSRYYDVILLDLGTGIIDPLVQFGVRRADQTVLVTTPEYVTAHKVLDSLRYLNSAGVGEEQVDDGITVVLNRAPPERSGDRQVIEGAFRQLGIGHRITIPHDDRLRVMLDSATYALESLPRSTRLPVKQLGVAIARGLV